MFLSLALTFSVVNFLIFVDDFYSFCSFPPFCACQIGLQQREPVSSDVEKFDELQSLLSNMNQQGTNTCINEVIDTICDFFKCRNQEHQII
jgi:hypothetical protein